MSRLLLPALILTGVCIQAVAEAKVIKSNTPRVAITDIDAEGNRDFFRIKIVNESEFEAKRPFLRVVVIRDDKLVFELDRMLAPVAPWKSLDEHISGAKMRLRKGDRILAVAGEETKAPDGKTARIGVTSRELTVVEVWRPVDRDFPRK
ncbi:MAG: hypothetical protein U0793_24580 [Gemmataceae bacterium]